MNDERAGSGGHPGVTVVNLAEKLALFEERWHPHLVAELNHQQVKLAKLEGEFIWHSHAEEDELFFVLSGTLRIELRGGDVTLGPGEMCVIPRGVEHRPVAESLVSLLLFEPASTRHTGDVESERTVIEPRRI
ncbi:MAG: cupin domain-containing protein [Gemmatimonadota bacterium]